MDKDWTPVEVATHIASVTEAFRSWNAIRDETAAQAYLVSLLGTKQRRKDEQPIVASTEAKDSK